MTPAQRSANARYQSTLDHIMIQPRKAEGECIRAAAAAAGLSVQAYILTTLRARMDADGVPPVRADETSTESNNHAKR